MTTDSVSISFSPISSALAGLLSAKEELGSALSALSTQVLQAINIPPVDSADDLHNRVSECSEQDDVSSVLDVTSELEVKDLRDCVSQGNYDQLVEMFPTATKEEVSEAFSCAIVYDNQRMMEFFFDKGASIYQHGEQLEETPLRTAIATNRNFAILLCRYEREIRDEHALSYAIAERDHKLIRLIMLKSSHMPATQEVLAKKVLEEEVPKANVSEQSIVKALMSGLKNVPYGLIKDLLSGLQDTISPKDIYRIYCIAFHRKDPKLLAVIKTEFPFYEEWAKVYFHSKIAGHVLGVERDFLLSGQEYGSIEIQQAFIVQLFKNYLQSFLRSSSVKDTTLFKLQGSLNRCYDGSRSIDEIVQSIRSGKPEIFISGWDTHAVAYVFHNGILVRCNRGGGSGNEPGLEFFSYDPMKVSRDLVSNLLLAMTHSMELTENYCLEKMQVDLEAEVIGNLKMSDQGKGNCGWASPKATVYALMITHLSKVHAQEFSVADKAKFLRKEVEQLFDRSKKAYKTFTRYTRGKAVKESLCFLFENSEDEEFVLQITRKAAY